MFYFCEKYILRFVKSYLGFDNFTLIKLIETFKINLMVRFT